MHKKKKKKKSDVLGSRDVSIQDGVQDRMDTVNHVRTIPEALSVLI